MEKNKIALRVKEQKKSMRRASEMERQKGEREKRLLKVTASILYILWLFTTIIVVVQKRGMDEREKKLATRKIQMKRF